MSIPWYYFYTPDYDHWHKHLQNTLSDTFTVHPILLDTIEGLHDQHPRHHWTGCSKKIQLLVDCIRTNIGRRIVFSDATLYINFQKVKELYELVASAPQGMTFTRNADEEILNICFMAIDCTYDVLTQWETILHSIGPNDHDQIVVNNIIRNYNFFDATKCIARWPLDVNTWTERYKSSFLVLKIFTTSFDTKKIRDEFRMSVMREYGYASRESPELLSMM